MSNLKFCYTHFLFVGDFAASFFCIKVILKQRSCFLCGRDSQCKILHKNFVENLLSPLMYKPSPEPLLAGALLGLIATATYLSSLELKIARSARVTLHLCSIIPFPSYAIIINFAIEYRLTAQEFPMNAKHKEFGICNE